MILGTSELKKISKSITSLNESNIRGASIDLSIGDKAKIKKDDRVIDLFKLDCDDNLCDDIYQEIDLAKGYELKPKEYLYSSSVEKITIPKNMCGIILPRSSFARIGLILPMSSYANPGYTGNLPIVIFNASNSIVKIPPYIRIMQLLFCEIKGEAIEYKLQEDSKYYNESSLKNPQFNDSDIKAILEKVRRK
ncbi:dCTP deaminase [Campylobacter coli]|uniref:dCTP deaminase n=1 Tax=Campylobacter TaxID=194 RepID=UPI00069ADE2B|nr:MULTISPECIES: dCTP deaminase [Campylobacter]HEE9536882.1 dCTP deaminase [Campylobacter jejuni subsp. jejuni]EAC1598528.1 dCTP deaminase [Campylobacter coli]EAC1776657.1 dCTP deaminase [Campylobacter coli]EAC1811357.1 dCTP deaminase [Campylobacter coli]EAH4784210.1 dCTP deaminase [Campylobacter coli]